MALSRTAGFCNRFGLRVPILLAPMAGASHPALSIAVANAGGIGACGVLLMQPNAIADWVAEFRAKSPGPFQLNTWIPDPPPRRDTEHERRLRDFLRTWEPAVPAAAGDTLPIDFDEQCEAMLKLHPPIISSVMGLYAADFVRRMKAKGITWFANISTVAEAKAAEAAGADVVVAQGAEAGGHRGCFNAAEAEAKLVGLFSLVPAVVDAVKIPVVATGGIADARGVAAALILGASAVQIGTGFLRSPEAHISRAWADPLASTAPEDTVISRVFSGRAGRSIETDFVRAASAADAPTPAPYPVQRGLTASMRSAATATNSIRGLQAWAGQSAALAMNASAASIVEKLWAEVGDPLIK